MANDQIEKIRAGLLSMFESGDLPPAAARTVIARRSGDNKPADKWSFGNQLLMILSGTEDARGFRQWQEVKRNVVKGARAIYILAPIKSKFLRSTADPVTTDLIQEEVTVIKGFRAIPVYRVEDTNGEPLPVFNYSPPQLPPLWEVAGHFGVVKYYPYANRELGSCSLNGDITLHSSDADVFFHELAHQVHGTIKPLQGGQHSDQELVAEMVACILCELYGYQGYIWQGWEYMKAYSGQEPTKTLNAIMKVLNEVDTVLGKIMDIREQIELTQAG